MASIIKRKRNKKTTFLVFIRRKGVKPMRKSFINKTDAKKWARAVERKLDTGDYSNYEEASKLLLGDLFKRYISENKHKKMKSWKMYEFRIRIILQDTITDINLLRISSKHLAEFRDRKLKEVGKVSFTKEALDKIEKMLDKQIKKEKKKIELQMRHDHINFDKRTLLIPFTKIGRPRTIPLSPKAIEILQSMPRRLDGKIFPLTRDSLRSCFKIAKRKAKIDGFRWHDLRRHACSLLFEKGFNVPEVQVFSGHRTSTILLNTYTKLDAEKIAIKLKERG